MPSTPFPVGFVRRGWSATGGAEAYLLRLAGELAKRGHPLTLYGSTWPQEKWPFGKVVRLPGENPMRFAQAFRAMRESARSGSAGEVIFGMERVPGCHVFRAGDGVHAAWLDRRRSFEPPWKPLLRVFNRKHRQTLDLERRVFDPRHTGFVLANSGMVAREIRDRYGFPAERTRVVWNGCAAPDFSGGRGSRDRLRHAARARWGLGESCPVALFVGSGWERKGLRHAVEAAASAGVPLLVAGKGPAEKYAAPHVVHLGALGDLLEAWAAADFLLQPTWYDPFSNACLEGLAAGLPVITTRDNGFSEVIEEGVTGSVVGRADDRDALRSAVEYWATKTRSGEAARHREVCRAAAMELGIEKNADLTLAVLEEAAESKILPGF